MMKRVIAAALVATLLGGCQSIFGHNSARLDVRPVGAEQSTAAALVSLKTGREQLTRGEVASAITSFRAASLDPATAAPAHNGLGVAYAMLGRGDLAERYFRQAVEEDPADVRFAANLARFYRSREAALARVQAVPSPVVVALANEADANIAEVAQEFDRVMRTGPGTVRLTGATRGSAMTRVSRQEVTIRTRPEAAAVAAHSPRRNARLVAIRPGHDRSAYPVRIDLARSSAP